MVHHSLKKLKYHTNHKKQRFQSFVFLMFISFIVMSSKSIELI